MKKTLLEVAVGETVKQRSFATSGTQEELELAVALFRKKINDKGFSVALGTSRTNSLRIAAIILRNAILLGKASIKVNA